MLSILMILLCSGMLISALLAVHLESMISAVLCAGLTGLFASVAFLLLAAPDVAMTEASIGSGLTTMIFLYAIRKTGNGGTTNGNGA